MSCPRVAYNLLYHALFLDLFLFQYFRYTCLNHDNWLYCRSDNVCVHSVQCYAWQMRSVWPALNVTVSLQNSFGRPDEVVAAETLANHVRCNNSFVHAVFQAQFRSSLTCPRCQRQSNTFDPFLCVSVPVPQNQRRAIYVTVLYTSQQPRQVCLIWVIFFGPW